MCPYPDQGCIINPWNSFTACPNSFHLPRIFSANNAQGLNDLINNVTFPSHATLFHISFTHHLSLDKSSTVTANTAIMSPKATATLDGKVIAEATSWETVEGNIYVCFCFGI